MMRVAFQGEPGAFSEAAARALFPGADTLPCASMEDVFSNVTNQQVERGVIPIENSLFGSVHVNYDLLRAHDVRIVGELMLRIRHCLMAKHGTKLQHISRVLSHPQALGQCQLYLSQHLPDALPVPAYDTAGAAKLVAEDDHPGAAAIASRRAAGKYGLTVLAENIESHPKNFTRFLALTLPGQASATPAPETEHKTSVAFLLRNNVPGALFKSLAVFALRDLDLYKIESRPLVGNPGKYLFYLDVRGNTMSTPVQRALEHLKEITAELRILGSYPVGAVLDDDHSDP